MNTINKTNNNFKVILFMCNWGPHAAFQTLQDEKREIPDEVHMVRIPCTGRIDRALLLSGFAMGADGVALIGCEPGSCRYGSGTATAQRNTQDMGEILELIGISDERLRFASFLPEESEKLLAFLQDFCADVDQMGHTSIIPTNEYDTATPLNSGQNLQELISTHDIHSCQDCGKCTSACPLALTGKPFSPRAIATAVIAGDLHTGNVKENVWSCLTCGLCYDRCPSAVNFPEFIKDLRHLYRKNQINGQETHGSFFHNLMRSMTSPDLKPKRWQDLPEEIKTDPESKVVFFGGCAPYFDIFFNKHNDSQTSRILLDSLRLLNFFDVYPRLMEEERCCGHDLLWSGDKHNFTKLARLNIDALNEMGIETLITSCPECYMTFNTTYPSLGIEVGFDVVHLYDFLEEEIERGAVEFTSFNRKITFQDSCRLNRLENKVDLPRKLIERLKPESFKEMQESGNSSICCGNCAWTGCDAFSKAMQVKRLEQAKETGSDLLVTACPKCQIHLKCAMEDPFRHDQLKMEMVDLTSLIAQTITYK